MTLLSASDVTLLDSTESEEQSVNEEYGDLELRIDFGSGSVIANERPKVNNPISDIVVAKGVLDTVIADLNNVFFDVEDGSQLSFSAMSFDTALVYVSVNHSDSTVTLRITPDTVGRTDIILYASDGYKDVMDTVSVRVKKRFDLPGSLSDTIIKASDTISIITIDISEILPPENIPVGESYTFSVRSSNEGLMGVTGDIPTKRVTLEVADSGFGKSEIEVTVKDKDNLFVRDTFVVTVMKEYGGKEYGGKEYHREQVAFNPGVSLFTGIDNSGIGVKLWYMDVVGIAVSGSFDWDLKGVGYTLGILGKPHINFVVQPYGVAYLGYHRQTVEKELEGIEVTSEEDLPLFVLHVAVGGEVWLGKTRQHAVSLEVGYSYGKSSYTNSIFTDIGSTTLVREDGEFNMAPLHLRLGYSFYFMKL